MRKLKSYLSEPLLHFFVFSVALLAAYEYWEPDNRDGLVFGASDLERLDVVWRARMGRAPTPVELGGLVSNHLREEVLYKEAMALGLDQDDIIIRRRLAQKMAFMTEAMVEAREPEPARLEEWFAAGRDKYKASKMLSFKHIYFSRNARGAGARIDALKVIETLKEPAAESEPSAELGDPFMLPLAYRHVSEREISSRFGNEFAIEVFALEEPGWQGPIASAYGEHLVYIVAQVEARTPSLAEVRERVIDDWRYEQKRLADRELIDELKTKYGVSITPEVVARINVHSGTTP